MLPGAITKEATATEPLGIVLAFSPYRMQIVEPGDEEHTIDFTTPVAPELGVTVTLEMSVAE